MTLSSEEVERYARQIVIPGVGLDAQRRLKAARVLVIGAGMVAHRFVDSLLSGADAGRSVTVIGEEGHPPYDRVGLTSFFSGATAEDLALDSAVLADERVTYLGDDPAVRIDRESRTVSTVSGAVHSYESLVLATGSSAPRVPVEGNDLPGCFVYRTLDDVTALRTHVQERFAVLGRPLRGAVVGGGLLGLEAAGALQGMGVECTVIQSADRLMSAQLDDAGGRMLQRLIEARGVEVRTRSRTTRIASDDSGWVRRVDFEQGGHLPADVVVFTVGVRPRDELARAAGIAVHANGGVLIDDACRTSDPRILAIGEVASFDGRCVGLVAPGYAMAEVAASGLLGRPAAFPGYDDATKLKLSGVDVASFGDAMATTPNALDVVYADPVAGVYKKLVLSDDAQTLLGGILVGDASAYGELRPLVGAARCRGAAAPPVRARRRGGPAGSRPPPRRRAGVSRPS